MRSAARYLLTAALMTVAVVGASASSKADMVTQTFTIASPITADGIYLGTTFNQFDPALGTLTSINLAISGNVVAQSGIVSLLLAAKTPDYPQPFNTQFSNRYVGNFASFTFNIGGVDTDPFDLGAFTGTGAAQFGFQITGSFQTPYTANINPNSTVTYNYTAAVAVPGPIAGAGIPALLALGGAFWARRRKALTA